MSLFCVQTISLSRVDLVVIDEADLVLSFGYDDDVKAVAAALPAGTQAMLMSATLTAVRWFFVCLICFVSVAFLE